MPRRPVIFLHGYSDRGESFVPWCRALEARGYDLRELNICSYESLTNEVTIRDLGEAFDRALLLERDIGADEGFDAIVHSTGMLVLRSWLTTRDPGRLGRLKHVVALAPATFGSPLAHRGRSTMGAIFKGNRAIGPDFLEAGDLILDGLELASRFQWDLTHQDVFGERVFYGEGDDTPWLFTFCGTRAYDGLRQIVNEPGTDGTVRWAGCSLSTRKITMDLTRRPTEQRVVFDPWRHVTAPVILIDDVNHATIVSQPPAPLVDLVTRALEVDSHEAYQAWTEAAQAASKPAVERMLEEDKVFQQFIVRAVDERGDPVTDYHVEIFTKDSDRKTTREIIEAFDADPHPYRGDRSLRCFHVNLSKVWKLKPQNLWLRVIVSSGSTLVGYRGHGSASEPAGDEVREVEAQPVGGDGSTELEIDLSEHLPEGPGTDFFVPFTTTLVEIRFDREPYPLTGVSRLLKFIEKSSVLS